METTMELSPEVGTPGTRSLHERQAATLAVLDSFMEQDEDEHRETLRVLRYSLDEDRPGQRRVFGEAATLKVSLIVLLDSGPLGLVTNPKESAEFLACKDWLRNSRGDGHQALVPAITDYEVRRELKLYGKVNGLRNLDALAASAGYVPLTPQALWPAADL